MDVHIYFRGSTGVALDELEDSLEDVFTGTASVVGTGSGETGSNIDLEIEGSTIAGALETLADWLAQLDPGLEAQVRIDGRPFVIGATSTGRADDLD